LLDYNSKNLTGKPSANDIKEKKLTLPLIYSLGKSKNSQSKKILRIINAKNHNPLIINDIIEYVHQSGGIVYTEKKMIEYKNKALDLISDYPSSAALDSIKELSDFVINRSK
jgi:octaprenyl-diphosphate synthase